MGEIPKQAVVLKQISTPLQCLQCKVLQPREPETETSYRQVQVS